MFATAAADVKWDLLVASCKNAESVT